MTRNSTYTKSIQQLNFCKLLQITHSPINTTANHEKVYRSRFALCSSTTIVKISPVVENF